MSSYCAILLYSDGIKDLIEVLKFIIPSVIVFFTAFYFFRQQTETRLQEMQMELKKQNQNQISPIRMQAYERLVLFLERISPQNLILTHNQPDTSAFILNHSLLTAIQQEYTYNLSQQVYVSNQSWLMIKIVKEQVVKLISDSFEKVNPTDSSLKLVEEIVKSLQQLSEQPTEKALIFLKQEMNIYFG